MGRLGGLSSALSNIAGKLKQDRLSTQDTSQKRGLLGFSSLLEGKTEIAGPEETGGIQIPGVGRLKPVKKVSKFGEEAKSFEKFKADLKPKKFQPKTLEEAQKFEEFKYNLKISKFGQEAQEFEKFKTGLKPSKFGPEALAFEKEKNKIGLSKFGPEAQEFERIKSGLKPEITKSTALNFLSNPKKSEQLKITYPDVFSLIENVARGETKNIKSSPGEKRIKVIDPSGNEGDIPASQLEQALKEGFKRAIK